MPSPGLWGPPREEGQERGWQGELREEKGAVSKTSSTLGLPSKKGPGHSLSCPRMFDVQCSTTEQVTNYRDSNEEKARPLLPQTFRQGSQGVHKRVLKIPWSNPFSLKRGKPNAKGVNDLPNVAQLRMADPELQPGFLSSLTNGSG